MRLSLLGLAAAGLAAAAAGAAGAPPAPLPVLGLTGASPNVKLVALDPRTLTPLASPRPLPVGAYTKAPPALSPSGDRLALPTRHAFLVVDRSRFRILRRLDARELVGTHAIVWSRSGWFILIGESGLGLELEPVWPRDEVGDLATEIGGDWARTPIGPIVLAPNVVPSRGFVLLPYTPHEGGGAGVHLPVDVATAMAVDAHHHQVFVISASGTVAVANLFALAAAVGDEPDIIGYHAVAFPGSSGFWLFRRFSAAWAGGHHIALVGAGGLSLIDTQDWSVRQIDPAVSDVAPAPGALVTWNRTAPTGITVYRPDGTVRFRALGGERVQSVGVTARYAYADTETRRFSIDLRTGQVTGPLSSRARLILPDPGLLDLP